MILPVLVFDVHIDENPQDSPKILGQAGQAVKNGPCLKEKNPRFFSADKRGSWNMTPTQTISNNALLLMAEILHHLGCMKPYEQWEKLPINWCRISSINSIVGEIPQNHHTFAACLLPPNWVSFNDPCQNLPPGMIFLAHPWNRSSGKSGTSSRRWPISSPSLRPTWVENWPPLCSYALDLEKNQVYSNMANP